MDYELINNILINKGLCTDLNNIIIEYAKPTLKEQCLDPKSLKKYEKHKQWMDTYRTLNEEEKEYYIHKSNARATDKMIEHFKKFKFYKDITPPTQTWIQNGMISYRMYPQKFLYKFKDEIIEEKEHKIKNLEIYRENELSRVWLMANCIIDRKKQLNIQ